MKVLKTIEGGTVIEGICLRKKIKINRGGPPVYSVPRSRFDKFPNQKMLQVFQVFNKLSEIQVKLKTKCMKTMGTHLDG